ncbi:hypothetical protein QC999_gp69 [Microbacterium phage Cressida]|uniref:Uncharacterized protein n=1 Tax=Microbacterium phage Cressida TaxID=2591216 RepID=A0A514DI40_9CAUD|nr:hypothetical protein QC999_gp69 [Microbacterium phage Cressida]QDH93281.1 hypothetical protein PBI_CRESSIDA_39 [Microbacterium phage Cressida]
MTDPYVLAIPPIQQMFPDYDPEGDVDAQWDRYNAEVTRLAKDALTVAPVVELVYPTGQIDRVRIDAFGRLEGLAVPGEPEPEPDPVEAP